MNARVCALCVRTCLCVYVYMCMCMCVCYCLFVCPALVGAGTCKICVLSVPIFSSHNPDPKYV